MQEIATTEDRIIEAARKIFARKGLQGARMQEIAEEAGINKALLHYYFRSKEKLFEMVFSEAFSRIVKHVNELLETDKPFFEKINDFIDSYIDVLNENPFLPSFIISEINQNPERIVQFIQAQGIRHETFRKQIFEEISKGRIKNIDPGTLIVNIIGLCVFPFIARPIIRGFVFRGREDDYTNFTKTRKEAVRKFVLDAIKPEPQ